MKLSLITLATFCLCLAGCGKKEQAKTPPIDPSKHERFLWAFETGDSVTSSPAIGSDGTVYVGSEDKKLYAIKTDSKGLAKSPWPMRGQNARHTGRVIKE
jgi:outer membrane protein assembly factor BamB